MTNASSGSKLRNQGSGLITTVALASLIFLTGCAGPNQPADTGPSMKGTGPAAEKPAPPPAPYYVYVTNEQGGDLTIVDGGTNEAVGTITVGKRPRGIKLSPDRTQLFVA